MGDQYEDTGYKPAINSELLADRVNKYEKMCPDCRKATICFAKSNQHKDLDCEFCGKALIRWEVKRII